MEEKEYQGLIDRSTSIGHVSKNFADIVGVFRDMVNYGSNLVPRCFLSCKRTLEDAIIRCETTCESPTNNNRRTAVGNERRRGNRVAEGFCPNLTTPLSMRSRTSRSA